MLVLSLNFWVCVLCPEQVHLSCLIPCIQFQVVERKIRLDQLGKGLQYESCTVIKQDRPASDNYPLTGSFGWHPTEEEELMLSRFAQLVMDMPAFQGYLPRSKLRRVFEIRVIAPLKDLLTTKTLQESLKPLVEEVASTASDRRDKYDAVVGWIIHLSDGGFSLVVHPSQTRSVSRCTFQQCNLPPC